VHREAIVKRKARTTARPFRPDALTWIDFLVIAAIALTFVAIASTASRAKASDYNDPPTFSMDTGNSSAHADLIKARIGIALLNR
jgi:hypothetical protein